MCVHYVIMQMTTSGSIKLLFFRKSSCVNCDLDLPNQIPEVSCLGFDCHDRF